MKLIYFFVEIEENKKIKVEPRICKRLQVVVSGCKSSSVFWGGDGDKRKGMRRRTSNPP